MGTTRLKQHAAEAAVGLVENGMVVGLGTGSTATHAIDALIRRVRDGLRIRCIPTSTASEAQAREGGLVISDFATDPRIDLTIDGADQIARGSLALVKGLGGALLREKIVAAASDRLVIIADGSKLVDTLGGPRTPVPIEVVPFGWETTATRLRRLGAAPRLRKRGDGKPFVTDGGNLILDCGFPPIDDPGALESRLSGVVVVIESVLFVYMASMALVATEDEVLTFTRSG
jgi:ribose 5-phosphate isomerase A